MKRAAMVIDIKRYIKGPNSEQREDHVGILSELEKILDDRLEKQYQKIEKTFSQIESSSNIGSVRKKMLERSPQITHRKKEAVTLFLSSFISGILILMAFLSSVGIVNSYPLFWFTAALPFLGISSGQLLILLGVDGDKYEQKNT